MLNTSETPDVRGRVDNIYRPKADGGYIQLRNDFHERRSIRKDLSADRVLASKTFVYFGGKAPTVPATFQEFVPHGRGHRVFGNAIGEPGDAETNAKIKSFVRWAFSRGVGRKGRPLAIPPFCPLC